MPKTKSLTSRSKARRRHRSRFSLGQIGAIALRRPIKLRNPQALLFIAVVAVVGAAAITFTLAATTIQTYSLWNDATTPKVVADSDAQPVELGVKFTASQDGFINGVKFYKSRSNTGTHIGNLWDANGALLARATFTNETANKWQTVKFATPVPVKAGQLYVASHHTNKGRYSADSNYFSQSRQNGPLTAPASTSGQPNGVYRYSTTTAFPTDSYRATNYWVDVIFATQTTTPTPTPTVTSSATPAPTSAPSGSCSGGNHVAGSADPWGGCWPGQSNTGVPAGTALSAYTGPCTITAAGTVIDSKSISCSLLIKASGVVIRKSRLNGIIDADGSSYSVTIQDSEINAGSSTAPALGYSNITAQRINVTGAQHSILCSGNCDIRDSYLHNQYVQGSTHNNAILSNGGSNMVFVHNTLYCEPTNNASGGGCSGDLSLFGDFAPITNIAIDKNLFIATPGSYCLYGGYQSNKTYGQKASNVDVTNNIFKRGSNAKCATYGHVTNFVMDETGQPAPGNSWIGNKWDDGGIANM